MSTFDDRESAYENKFVHDEELRFKATARRNKLLGIWASEKLGFSGEKVDEYAKAVVVSDFEEPGDEDVIRKVMADLNAANTNVSETELREKLVALMGEAIQQIESGSK
ncbi:MAG: hypothetical protein COA52_18790 [Hyphomicrobiales bacterium]|nr:DUF1476 domain-containing protein [Hyphomicrobiales bacterium]PCJ83488.1 MAG: hypothetical protein COA52_18790 [Hyphomicrobiales bacterium]